jgi:hypothetical protein
MSGSARRRADRARLKHKRQFYGYSGRKLKDGSKELGRVVDTPKTHTCYMCGNPRRYFSELTIQERRWFQEVDDDDVDDGDGSD